MAGEIKLNNVSIATENAGTVTIAPNNVQFAANHAGIKTALNASGSAPVYACRAWVNFNGTGTVAIRSSGNVSSITDNGGLGNYRVNFTTAMPDSNYCVQLSHSTPTGDGGQHAIDENDITTTYVDVITWDYAVSAQKDRSHVYVSIFR